MTKISSLIEQISENLANIPLSTKVNGQITVEHALGK